MISAKQATAKANSHTINKYSTIECKIRDSVLSGLFEIDIPNSEISELNKKKLSLDGYLVKNTQYGITTISWKSDREIDIDVNIKWGDELHNKYYYELQDLKAFCVIVVISLLLSGLICT